MLRMFGTAAAAVAAMASLSACGGVSSATFTRTPTPPAKVIRYTAAVDVNSNSLQRASSDAQACETAITANKFSAQCKYSIKSVGFEAGYLRYNLENVRAKEGPPPPEIADLVARTLSAAAKVERASDDSQSFCDDGACSTKAAQTVIQLDRELMRVVGGWDQHVN